jgi:predicted  nucleic acid-binding Zn-ribbon protein
MPAEDRAEKVAFQRQVMQLSADLQACRKIMEESSNKLKHIKEAIKRSELPYESLSKEVLVIESKLKDARVSLYGDPVKRRLDISQVQNPASRIGKINYQQKYSTSAPTKTHRDSYSIAKEQITEIKKDIEAIYNVDIKQLEKKLFESGAPYTPGRGYENKN